MKQSTLYSKGWYAYVILYLVYFTIQELIPTRNILHDHLGFLYTLIGILGVVFLAWDFFSKRRMLKIQGIDILVLFFLASMLSVFVNYRYDLTGNLKCMLWTAIQILLLGAIDPSVPKKEHIRRLCIVFDIFILLWLVGTLWALWQYIIQFHGTMETIRADRLQALRVGFVDGRLFGMFEDPNYAAFASLFAIGLAVFCMRWGKRPKLFQVYYGFTIAMQICYIILSGSRAGMLAAMATAFFGCGFLAALKWDRNVILRVTGFLLAGCLGTALLLGGCKLLQTGLSYVPSIVAPQTTTDPDGNTQPGNLTPVDFNRDDVQSNPDVSNNRFHIWADYLEVWKSTPIFGASPRGYLLYAEDNFDDLYIVNKQYINVHNGYFALFVGVGALGGCIMVFWIIRILSTILGFLVRRWNCRDENYWMVFLLTLLMVTMGVAALTVQGIFFFNMITDILFWLVVGVNLYLIRDSEPERYATESITEKLCNRITQRLHISKS